MRKRVLIFLGLLALAVGLGVWWSSSGSGRSPVKNSATNATAAAAKKPVATNAVAVKSASANVSNANKLAFRLTNTPKTIGELESDRHAILLENAFIDTSKPLNFSIPKNLQAPGDPGAYIVQARGPIGSPFRAAVTAAGGRIVSYIPNDAYLVELTSSQAGILSGNPLVQAVLPYEPYYKVPLAWIGLALDGKSLKPGTAVNLGLFAGTDVGAVEKQLQSQGVPATGTNESPFGPVVSVLPPTNWTALAQMPEVQVMEPVYQRKAANDLSRVTVGETPDTTSSITNNWLGLTGNNVLVAVNDSGIDKDHPDFTTGGNAQSGAGGAPIRVIGFTPDDLTDTNGHGTFVAGEIAGNGAESLTLTNEPEGSVSNADFRGKAPSATLFSIGLNHSDRFLQQEAALTNALISNNSWDYDGDADYDLAAASYDAATRDAIPTMTGSQPMLFVFAAGNSGGGNDSGGEGAADTILSPGTAKNVITVGALEQLRNITNIVTMVIGGNTNKTAWWQPKTDSSAQVAGYSSRGNVGVGTEGTYGRFKPDVVSPGTFVVSTSSQFNHEWDTNAYYNPTNVQYTSYSGQVVETNSLVYYSVSVPPNAVGVNVTITTNRFSHPFPTNMPIYVELANYPDPVNAPNSIDFTTSNNMVSIPPDNGNAIAGIQSIQNSGFYFAVGNSTNVPVNYDLTVAIETTNDLGDYYSVLEGMNDSLGGYYRYESGTSMSAADVSGVLALIEDYFTNKLALTPSPALLKAMLINGARSVGSYSYTLTNGVNFQGWGLVNITNSLPLTTSNLMTVPNGTSPAPLFFADQSPANALATGDSHTYIIQINTNSDSFAQYLPLQATLVWTDPSGDPAAAIKLVNNLDLVITNLDTGDVYFGNDIAPDLGYNLPWDTNSPPKLDTINNVENIILPPLLAGSYSVTVIGREVNVNAVTAQTNNVVQDYALVVSIGEGEVPDAISSVTEATNSNPTADQQITFVTSTNSPLFDQFVGANTPLLGTNTLTLGTNTVWGTNGQLTVGMTNQWHFYVVTNNAVDANGQTSDVTNAAFITFDPNDLSVPRMGVYEEDDPANATRPEADIDLYVSTDPALTNLDPVVLSNCLQGTEVPGATFYGASLSRGGTEYVFSTNSRNNMIYYVGVKSEDQMASEYAFLPVFTATPFSQINSNGDQVVNGLLLPVGIPDGNNAHPGVTNIFALAIYPMTVGKVTVTNLNEHQNFGDLFGAMTFGGTSVVLNNHDGFGNTFGTLPLGYDDSADPVIGTRHTDGPGSLANYRGMSALGPWILSEEDNSLTQTGQVSQFSLTIQPHRDLTGPGIIITLQPGEWFIDYVDVPPGYTNLTLNATNTSTPSAQPPIQMYERFANEPTATDYDQREDLTNCVTGTYPAGLDPGNSISVGPPLDQGQYFVGLFNPSSSPAVIFLSATLGLSTSANTSYNYNDTNGSTTLPDDAVTNVNGVFVTATNQIASVNVGMVVNTPRISDYTFTLVSPTGQRILLMENRGGSDTNGAGGIVVVTNTTIPSDVSVVAGAFLNPANGHFYYLLQTNDWTASEAMAVALGGHLATINDAVENSWVLNTFSPPYVGAYRELWIGLYDPAFDTLTKAQGHGTNFVWVDGEPVTYTNWSSVEPNNGLPGPTREYWTYMYSADQGVAGQWNDFTNLAFDTGTHFISGVAEVTPQTNYIRLVFTDDTNLATTPIKFAEPPYNTEDTGTNFLLSDFEGVTNGDYFGQTNINDAFGGWTVPTNLVTISTVFSLTNNQFMQVTNVVVLTNNEVSVVTDPSTAQGGSNYLALAKGAITRSISTIPGRLYNVTFWYRGPGIAGWWRGEGNGSDSSDPETNGNNGTLVGRFNFPAGVVGQAFQFPETANEFDFGGTNTYVQIPQNPSLDVGKGGGFTVEGWINPTNLTHPQPLVEWLAHVPTNSAVTNIVIKAGPYLNPATGHYYYLLAATNWLVSEEWATNLGGHLVTIDSANEQNWVFDNFADYGGTNRNLWIGLTNSTDTTTFGWISGETNVAYTNWFSTQPTNCDGSHGYTFMFGETNLSAGLWTLADTNGFINCGSTNTNIVYGVVEVTNIQTNGVQFWISVTNTPDTTNAAFVSSNGCLYANIVDTNFVSHEIYSAPGLLRSNIYQHVALTFNTNSGIAELYLDGTNVATTNLFTTSGTFMPFVPKTDGDVLLGRDMYYSTNSSLWTNNYYVGEMDEMSIYSRAMSDAEIAAIYRISVQGTNGLINTNGIVGKFDPSVTPALGLAEAQVAFGDTTNIIFGVNNQWEVYGFAFTATSNSFPLQISGLEPGILLDDFAVSEAPLTNLYYLPEQSLDALAGTSAYGDWTLQVWDNRADGPVTNLSQLVNWQLSFILNSNALVSASLDPQTPIASTVEPGQTVYYSVPVPLWAKFATNILVSSSSPVDLLFNPTNLPTGSNPGDLTLLGNSTSGVGTPDLAVNSPLPFTLANQAGSSYYLGVRNNGSHAASIVLQVNYDMVALTNDIPYTNSLSTNASDAVRYFSFDVSSNAYEATFQLLKLSGNADLVVRKGVPLPTLTDSDYGSFNVGDIDENIYVLTNSAPVPLSAGRWYLGVIKRDSGVVNYTVLAKYLNVTNGVTNSVSIISLTNGVPFNWTAGPGAALTNFFRFKVTNTITSTETNYVKGVRFELYNLTGNGDLTVQTNRLPLSPPFYESSQNSGRNPELVLIYTNSALTNLAANWYLGVPNNERTNIAYTIIAEIETNSYFPAFPGAAGCGGGAVGAGHAGTNSTVYHVTSTDDSGPGTLRDAVNATNRTVVFDISGTINLALPLVITNSYLTIAGQTAPGGGITVAGEVTTVTNAHDVVIRDVRFRSGEVLASPAAVWANGFEGSGVNYTPAAGSYLAGWLVDFGSVDWLLNGFDGYTTPQGTNFIDLDGSAAGGISTNIPTISGVTYTFSFIYTRDPGLGAIAAPQAQILINGNPLGTVTANLNNSAANLQWQTTSFVFTATSPSTKLAVHSLDPSGNIAGVMMDAFSLTANANAADSLQFINTSNAIADHISASWSSNNLVSVLNSSNVTVQWSIMADSLYNTNNPQGFGSLLRYGSGALSFHHNLYADNYQGSPRLGDNLSLDFVNNVIYNWGINSGFSSTNDDAVVNVNGFTNQLNYVCNYLIAGADTAIFATNLNITNIAFIGGTNTTWIFQTNNFIDSDTNGILNGANTQWSMFTNQYTRFELPFPLPLVPTDEAYLAYEKVLDFAGTDMDKRDSVDTNIVYKVRTQTGRLISSAGLLPLLGSTLPYLDTDQDGIPDFWEDTFTPTNVFVPSNNNDRDGDGYTDLEEYNNWLAAPHAITVTTNPVGVDLQQMFGKTGNLSFYVTNGVNGFVYLTNVLNYTNVVGTVYAETNTGPWSNTFAIFTPTNNPLSAPTNFSGYASFDVYVTNNDTVAYFGPTKVSVMASAVPVVINSNFPPVIIELTNGVPSDPTNYGGSDFYHITVTTNDFGALFELDDPTGPMALVVKKDLPLPSLSSYDYYTNAPPSPANQQIAVLTNSMPVPLSPGDWYMAAVNVAGTSVVYTAKISLLHGIVPPVFTFPTNGEVFTNIETTLFTTNCTATDPNSPALPLTYSLVSGPTNLTVSSGGAIDWTPDEAQGPSTNAIQVSVSNGAFSITNNFTVVVEESNLPPVLPTIPYNLVLIGTNTLMVTNTAMDPDIPTNVLTYMLLSAATNAMIDTNTGIITWTPTPAQVNTNYLFTTVVTDTNPWAINSKSLSDTNRFYVTVLPPLPVGQPLTNTVPAGGISWFGISVPTNALMATNILLYATNLPVNVWFSTNAPPSITNASDFDLLPNAVNGKSILTTSSAPTNIVPGRAYYLGVQNTNSVDVGFGLEVNFLLSVQISSIVHTNIGETNGFLLTWFAPSNDLFQVQWTPSLVPTSWSAFTNIVSYNTSFPANITNAQFNFFDDGSQTDGFGPTRFYRLILLQLANALTLPSQTNLIVSAGATNVIVTNTATDSDPNALLTYNLVNPPVGASINPTNGVITWTNATPSGIAARFTTTVVDNDTPSAHATNTFTIFVTPFPSITNVTVNATNVVLQWVAPTNDAFEVQWTTNLAPPDWQIFTNGSGNIIINSTNGAFSFTDTNAPLLMKFYELILLP